jgi:DNA-binding CsgD family transcriptional regulator
VIYRLPDLILRLKDYIMLALFEDRMRNGQVFEVSYCENSSGAEAAEEKKPELIDMLFSSATVQLYFEEKGITIRELDVIKWVLKGSSFDKAGDELIISATTAKKHWFNAINKLPVNNKSELFILLMEKNAGEPASR